MSNDDASVPSRVYSSVSPLSAGVAVTGAPTSTPAALFSGTARLGAVSEKPRTLSTVGSGRMVAGRFTVALTNS